LDVISTEEMGFTGHGKGEASRSFVRGAEVKRGFAKGRPGQSPGTNGMVMWKYY